MAANPMDMATDADVAPSRAGRADPRRVRDLIQVVAFALALLLPGAGLLLGLDDFERLAENRRPADPPAWPADWETTRAFPAAFERWFDDHFGFRSFLVGRDKRIEWLGRRTEVEIRVGRDGWLFQGDARSVASFHCPAPAPSDRGSWLALAGERARRFPAEAGRFYWAMAPSKHSVHPEALPDGARGPADACARQAAFVDAIAATGVRFVALGPALRDARGAAFDARGAAFDGAPLYHATDTHWNQLGAAIAVARLLDAIRADHPEVAPFAWSDYAPIVEPEPFRGDLAQRLLVYGEDYTEPFRRLERLRPARARRVDPSPPLDLRRHAREDAVVAYSTGDAALPTALVFHDSFAYAAMPLLAEHFAATRFVSSNGWILEEEIEAMAPDVVISLGVEAKWRGPAPAKAR